MASFSEQDVRANGVSLMQKKFWIIERGGLEAAPGFRSTNFEIAYFQGAMWRHKQIAEATRSIPMQIDCCDDDGNYPTGRPARIAQLNANRHELLGIFARENAQVTIERDVLIADGVGGYDMETWTGYAQASNAILPEYEEDFPDHQTCIIDLLFADPIWYGEEIVETITGTDVITNPGNVDATNMLIELIGGTDPRLTNETPDPEVWVQISRTLGGDSVDIDTRAGTAVRSNGNNVIGYLSKDGARQFMRIVPGANTMTISGGGTATITYRPPRS